MRAFSQTTKFITPEKDYGELIGLENCPPLAFALKSLAKDSTGLDVATRPTDIALPFEVAFITEDVDAAVDKALAAGATLAKAAVKKPWGQTVAYVRDCNGFLIELCTEVKGSAD